MNMTTKPTYKELEQRVQELEQAVSERKKTEELLWWQKQFFSLLVNYSSDILVFINKNGEQKFISPSAERITGYTVGELQRPFAEIIHPEDLPRVERGFEKLLNNPEAVVTVYYRHKHKDGGYRYFETVGRNFLDNPLVQGIVANVRDITERRRMEEALRKSEEKFRSLAENQHDVVWTVNENLEIDYISPSCFKMTGTTAEETMGMNPKEFYTEESYQRVMMKFAEERQKAPNEIQPVVLEVDQYHKDGHLFPVEITCTPIIIDNKFIGVQGITRDITEKKKAEEALLNQKYLLQKAQEIGHIGAWELDIKKNELLWTDENYRIFGLPIGTKLTYETFLNCVHPDDREYVDKEWKAAFDKKFYDIEHRLLVDGKVKWVRAKAEFRFNEKDEYIRGTGVTQDITVSRQAEEALRESKEKLRTVIEHSNELFYIHDTEHTFIYATQTSVDLLGYTPEEMMRKWTELATDNPINQKGLEITEQGIATGKKQAPYLLELAKKDGTTVLVEIDESPVKDATGKVVAISGAARDVTEQKRTEQRLLKSEKGFRDLFDSITDLIYTQDLDGRFTSVNRAMCKAFGYEKDALIGRPSSDFMKPEMKPFFESVYLEQIKTKGSHEGITSYFAKNGKKIYIDYRSSLVEPDDGEPYISGTGRDMTEWVFSQREIKRLQNQVHQSQKMEAIGLMAGGVAHDLNNILSGIVSYPELLLMDLPENSPLRKPIKTIQESGMRAAEVVDDLLTIARGAATGKEALNLNVIVSEYLESPEYRKLENTHPFVHFKTELDPDLLNMSGSPIHIKKILMNLVNNASEAIEGAGTVTISTMNRHLDEPLKGYVGIRTGRYVMLTVSDNGSGISPQDLERIFEPFYTKKVMGRSGTGLGLAVVWNTVQDHKGYINVQSSKTGTAFELYFPVTRKEVSDEKEKIPLENYLGHGEKILVVDDEERQREIACGMLTRLGYNAEAVSSGEEAVRYLKEKQFHLIVLDMVMPKGMNGRETYEEIIKICPGQKAIIASGFSETEEVKMARKSGAGNYIKKPYILEKIGLAVKEELEE